MKYSAPKGTHDVIPGEIHRWQALQREFQNLVELYGYEEIRTPIFEETDLFLRSSGESSEVVSKQMYTFLDKKGRSNTLKPEETAPAMRAYLENQLGGQGQITKLWYFAPIFRYEQPQSGRQRQHHQFGIEFIGSSGAAADAEVIEIAIEFYKRIGLQNLSVSLNSIGRKETRERFRDALLAFIASFIKDESEEVQQRADQNPLRLLDSKDPELLKKLVGAPKITEYLEDESRQHLDSLCQLLAEANVTFEIDPSIVRGLDYYTDTVFEVKSDVLGAQSTLCGGGRYDNLISELGGPPTPSVGFGMGVERALIAQDKSSNVLDRPKPDAFIVCASESAREEVRKLAKQLRQDQFAILTDTDNRNVKAQFKLADRSRARFAIVIGKDELNSGTVTVRNLESGEQSSASPNELTARMRS